MKTLVNIGLGFRYRLMKKEKRGFIDISGLCHSEFTKQRTATLQKNNAIYWKSAAIMESFIIAGLRKNGQMKFCKVSSNSKRLRAMQSKEEKIEFLKSIPGVEVYNAMSATKHNVLMVRLVL